MIEVTIRIGGKEALHVVSDGNGHYKIEGTMLRGDVREYETDDDFHVAGLIHQTFGAQASLEVIRRALRERDKIEREVKQ